jgi:Dolichyl-phosphate-mannose-protein mannosyltransferase
MSTTPRLAMFSHVLGGFFAAVVLFGFLWMNITGSSALIPAFAILLAATLAVARYNGDTALAALFSVRRVLPAASPGLWLVGTIALGITLRIFVAALYPATPQDNWNGDMLRYLDLAHKIAGGMDYDSLEGRAFWPPGLPLALALLLPVFGALAAFAYNIITFVIAEIATFVLGRMMGGWRVGCLAAFFLAVWPNFVFAAPLLNKECLLIVLWPTAAYFYLKAHEVLSDGKSGIYALLAGASLGYSALTQPATLLLPVCLPLYSSLTNGWRRRTFICVLAAACGVVAVLTPWTVRNYVVFHHFVPIGSAGSQNLFFVTRPTSDGRWDNVAAGEWFALSADEMVRNELGYSIAIKSIRDHPFYFFSTMAKKPSYIYGQDMNNIHWNFDHKGGEARTLPEYALACWLSNGFYLAIILLISMGVMGKQYVREGTPAEILLWMFILYPMLVHSVFEAAERHHYGAVAFIAIFAAIALVRAGQGENTASGEVAAGSEILSLRLTTSC